MTKVFADNEWFRKSFSSHESIINTPPLMNLQIQSYEDFLQKDVPHSSRKNIGLHAVFNQFSLLWISIKRSPWSMFRPLSLQSTH